MNMKKLMAGVVAGALAVSTLAASAFAAVEYPIKNSEASKTYTTEVKGTQGLSVWNATAGKLTVTPKLPEGVKVESITKVTFNYYNAKDEKYVDVDGTFADGVITVDYSTTAGRSGMVNADFSKEGIKMNYEGMKITSTVDLVGKDDKKLSDGADWTDLTSDVINFTATVKNSGEDDPEAGVSAWFEWAGCGKATVTETAGPRYKIDFKAEFNPADLASFKNMSLQITVDGTPQTDTPAVYYVPVKLTGAANKADDKTLNAIFDGNTATVKIDDGFVYVDDRGFPNFGGKVEIDIAKAVLPVDKDGNKLAVKTVSVFADLDEQQPSNTSDTSDTQVSEDDPTNTSASDTQAPASSDDNGNTNAGTGDDKNQPTGVALAVIPAIVAAAGVVIAKKRG